MPAAKTVTQPAPDRQTVCPSQPHLDRCIGRLAPSPTGAQHVGNARTYLLAWLLCRNRPGGRLLLRIEDLETPRVKTWAVDQIYEDLRWIGLDWDESPRDPRADGPLLQQSLRSDRYREVLRTLIDAEAVYPCTCSRSDIAAAATAPHESTLDGTIYPGTCRDRSAADWFDLRRRGRSCSLRFRWNEPHSSFCDSLMGAQSIDPAAELGDFIVWRNDDQAAYQLAVVVDDHDAAVSQVVRGADLVYSTFRQIALIHALGWQRPQEYFHVPLVLGADGRRLAKRHGDTRLSSLRESGVRPGQLIGYLAWRSGLIESPAEISAAGLLDVDTLGKLSRKHLIFDQTTEIPLILSIDASRS